MKLHTQIKEEMKEAMKAREAVRLQTLRSLLSEFTNELITQKKKPDEMLSDDAVMKVIAKEAKKRKDSIEQFTKGGRPELAEAEQEELTILETYLPAQLGKEEIEAKVAEIKEKLGITDETEKGKLIGAVMQELKGVADGNLVKEVVDNIF